MILLRACEWNSIRLVDLPKRLGVNLLKGGKVTAFVLHCVKCLPERSAATCPALFTAFDASLCMLAFSKNIACNAISPFNQWFQIQSILFPAPGEVTACRHCYSSRATWLACQLWGVATAPSSSWCARSTRGSAHPSPQTSPRAWAPLHRLHTALSCAQGRSTIP